MKRKTLLVALALVCALTCAFGLVACDNGNNDNGGTGKSTVKIDSQRQKWQKRSEQL